MILFLLRDHVEGERIYLAILRQSLLAKTADSDRRLQARSISAMG
jgi:hypothetical protein